jgi:hypothetical protein
VRRTLLFARREAAIPVADVAALHGPWRRTTVVRLGLAALLVTALAATLLAARALEPSKAAFLPRGTSGVIVLDVSLSVTDPTFRRIHNAIQMLANGEDPAGFVAFSDVAYELLPPGSPPEELKPLLRYFKALPERDPTDPLDVRYPANPWAAGFSAGTKISGGLRLGKEILEREGIENGSILLVSDLDTAPSDESSLTQVLADVESDGIDLHVVPLFPQPADRAFFVEALGEEALITPPQLAARNRARAEASLLGANPSLLALLGGAVLLLLAVNEWWGARVELPRRRPA